MGHRHPVWAIPISLYGLRGPKVLAAALTWISEVKVGRKWACLQARSISLIKWAEVVDFVIFGRARKHARFQQKQILEFLDCASLSKKPKDFQLIFYDLSLFPYELTTEFFEAHSKNKSPTLIWWEKQVLMKKQQFQKSTALRPLLVPGTILVRGSPGEKHRTLCSFTEVMVNGERWLRHAFWGDS